MCEPKIYYIPVLPKWAVNNLPIGYSGSEYNYVNENIQGFFIQKNENVLENVVAINLYGVSKLMQKMKYDTFDDLVEMISKTISHEFLHYLLRCIKPDDLFEFEEVAIDYVLDMIKYRDYDKLMLG